MGQVRSGMELQVNNTEYTSFLSVCRGEKDTASSFPSLLEGHKHLKASNQNAKNK